MSPKIIDKKAKKLEILQTAMKVFAQKGVANTKMADVAEAAGIGKGTIYEYFKNKEDIFNAAFGHFMEQMNDVMAKRLYRIYDPIEKLEALVAGWVEIMQDTSIDFMEIMMDFWAEGVRKKQEKMMFDLKSMYDEYRQMVVEILEDGIAKGRIKPINTTCTASILIGAIDGLMLQWIMDRDLFRLDEISEVFNKSFIDGLKTE